uniref:Uncharacterized protein n=1 Tax=Lactuca sativa TaxID=4236 RepID=A0A9R1XNU5_LACSA|nr:hypothetical protein LSAT_V11C300125350 [Lactuca sativa]
MVKKEVVQDFNPLIINQAASLSTFLSLPFSESVTVNIYAFILSPIPCLFVTLVMMDGVEYVKKDEKGDPSAKKDSHMLDDLDLHAPDTLDSALGIYIH